MKKASVSFSSSFAAAVSFFVRRAAVFCLALCLVLPGPAFAGQTVIIDADPGASVYGNGELPDGSWNGVDPADLENPDNNKVIVNSYVDGNVTGGHAKSDSASAAANDNSVVINSGEVNGYIRGGNVEVDSDDSAAVGNNAITISNGNAAGFVLGGRAVNNSSGSSAAVGNTADIINNSEVKVSVRGGSAYVYADDGDGLAVANSNIVTIANSNVNTNSGDVNGGRAYIEGDGSAVANSNTVTVNNSGTGYIFGGYTNVEGDGSAKSNNNIITIINSESGFIFGGGAYIEGNGSSAANNNTVTLANSYADAVLGGEVSINYDGSSAANGNTVTLVGSNVDEEVVGGAAYVDGNGSPAANNNTVTLANSYVGNYVYGGLASALNAGSSPWIMTDIYGLHGLASSLDDCSSSAVNSNTVTITGGGVDSYVRGGNAYVENDGSAAANNNIVTVNAGNIGDEIRGGSARVEGDGSSAANGNTVTVNAGSVYDVYGGYAEVGDGSAAVNNNTVSIIGGSYVDSYYNYINGGFAFVINGAAAAANNSVIIDNSRVESNVYGGYANVDGDGSAAAAYNTVSITNSYVSCVYGGHAYVDGDGPAVAANNTLIIADSYVDGEVLGGYAYAGDSAIAINNTVTVIGNTVFGYSLYGGYTNGAGAGDAFTGNTLNLRSGSIRAGNGGVGNFQYYNFVFPVTQTVPVLTSGGAVVLGDGNGTGSTVTGVNTTGSSAPLKAGVSITLIQAVTLDDTDFTQTQTQGQHGIGLRYKWALEADTANNKLIATVLGIDANPQTKILSEGAAAGAILARQGAENINGALLNGLQEGKIEAIASVFGGSSKYDTGSSVEMSIFGAALGAAKKFASFDAGAFIEYASGSFDTEHKGLKGDGETTAIGIGIVAKKDVKEDVYIEGLIRAGQVSNDYKSKIVDTMGTVFNTDFDYSAMYFGISLGGGRIFKVNEKVNVDAFAKYALTSTGGGDADLSSGNKYEFDSILSNRIKAGAKGEYKINDKFTPYLALSYDYELSGDINAKIDGYEVEEPSLNGGTFSGGLGVNAKAAEKLTLDLSINGYSGVREGVIGSLQVKYEF